MVENVFETRWRIFFGQEVVKTIQKAQVVKKSQNRRKKEEYIRMYVSAGMSNIILFGDTHVP